MLNGNAVKISTINLARTYKVFRNTYFNENKMSAEQIEYLKTFIGLYNFDCYKIKTLSDACDNAAVKAFISLFGVKNDLIQYPPFNENAQWYLMPLINKKVWNYGVATYKPIRIDKRVIDRINQAKTEEQRKLLFFMYVISNFYRTNPTVYKYKQNKSIFKDTHGLISGLSFGELFNFAHVNCKTKQERWKMLGDLYKQDFIYCKLPKVDRYIDSEGKTKFRKRSLKMFRFKLFYYKSDVEVTDEDTICWLHDFDYENVNNCWEYVKGDKSISQCKTCGSFGVHLYDDKCERCSYKPKIIIPQYETVWGNDEYMDTLPISFCKKCFKAMPKNSKSKVELCSDCYRVMINERHSRENRRIRAEKKRQTQNKINKGENHNE